MSLISAAFAIVILLGLMACVLFICAMMYLAVLERWRNLR